MQVTTVMFDQKSNVASWRDGSNTVTVQQLRHACCDTNRGLVFGLPEAAGMKWLEVYDHGGALIAQLTPPHDFQLEYLVEDATHGVRAICSGLSATGDTMDWYFKIDLSTGCLVKQSRAY